MTTNTERDSVTARIDALLELAPVTGDSAETRLIKRAKLTPWHGDPDYIAQAFEVLREARAYIESTRAPDIPDRAARLGIVSNPFTEMLIGVIADVQRELGFTDEEVESANGSMEMVAAIRKLKAAPQPSVSAAEGDGWRPISSVPRNIPVLALGTKEWNRREVSLETFPGKNSSTWFTHWRPLPPPPKEPKP